jgi:hypothetical protein
VSRTLLGFGVSLPTGHQVRPWASSQDRTLHTSLRVTALVAGLIGLSGTVLFLQRRYLGLGMGGMERVAAWPLLIFLAVAGITFIETSRTSQ